MGRVIRKGKDSIARVALRRAADRERREKCRAKETWRRTMESEAKEISENWRKHIATDRERWETPHRRV